MAHILLQDGHEFPPAFRIICVCIPATTLSLSACRPYHLSFVDIKAIFRLSPWPRKDQARRPTSQLPACSLACAVSAATSYFFLNGWDDVLNVSQFKSPVGWGAVAGREIAHKTLSAQEKEETVLCLCPPPLVLLVAEHNSDIKKRFICHTARVRWCVEIICVAWHISKVTCCYAKVKCESCSWSKRAKGRQFPPYW